jgi:hypothetical protein
VHLEQKTSASIYEWVKTLSKKDDAGNDELMKIGFVDIAKEAHT